MRTKNNAAITVLSSIVCLLPLILSAAVYDDLPGQIAVHWDVSGNPDSFAPKAAAALGMPFLFFALNIVSKARLYNDPKRADASRAMRAVIAWLVPLLSIVIVPVTLFIAMGASIPVLIIIPAFVGALLVIAGNYLPKSRRNYTIGIKLPWTLHSADNWNKTHRLAGYLWILGGVSLIAAAFAANGRPGRVVSIGAITVGLSVAVPVCYSFILYKKTAAREDGK